MKRLILTKVPEEFLTGNLIQDVKKDLREFKNKSNVTNADALRYMEKSYSLHQGLSFTKVKQLK